MRSIAITRLRARTLTPPVRGRAPRFGQETSSSHIRAAQGDRKQAVLSGRGEGAQNLDSEAGIGLSAAKYLVEEKGVVVVGADNWALEVIPAPTVRNVSASARVPSGPKGCPHHGECLDKGSSPGSGLRVPVRGRRAKARWCRPDADSSHRNLLDFDHSRAFSSRCRASRMSPPATVVACLSIKETRHECHRH